VPDKDDDDPISRCATLAPREKGVLRGLARYKQPKEIALELNISVNTVRGYVNDARQKLGVGSQREAARVFDEYERRLPPPRIAGGQSERVAAPDGDATASARGLEETILIDPDVATREAFWTDGAPAPGAERAAPDAHFGSDPDVTEAEPSVEGAVAAGPGNSSRFDLHGRLGRMSPGRWMGLSLVLTLAIIAAFGIGAVSLLGVFEVLEQIGGPHP
jgi:DNA-binding CsgD family transcriptional regulator